MKILIWYDNGNINILIKVTDCLVAKCNDISTLLINITMNKVCSESVLLK